MNSPTDRPPSRTSLLLTAIQRGLERLPLAERPAVVAGYTAMAAAVLAILAFAFLAVAVDALLGQFDVVFGVDGTILASLALLGLPFVVLAAFVGGALSVHVVPSRVPYRGVVSGLLGTIATYVIGAALLASVVLAGALASTTGAQPVDAIGVAIVVGYLAFLYTAWLTLPIGCATGHLIHRLHETA